MKTTTLDLSILYAVKDNIFFVVVHNLVHIQFCLKGFMCTAKIARLCVVLAGNYWMSGEMA